MRWLSWALCCCLLIIAALLRKRGGTLRELRLAQPARTPTKFLVLMMKGRVAPASAATSTGATRREVRLFRSSQRRGQSLNER